LHVHILGIGGTFMGGIAAIAAQAGFRVTGSDRNVYPPMSAQLAGLGIELVQGYEAAQLDPRPDVVIVGNALSRGVPVVEAMLDCGIPYSSGPQWLAETVLAGKHVLAVAGTHGKTTTTSMLAWILEHEGLAPGFLIGGVPANFTTTARLGVAGRGGSHELFVIEADEYDTAFFDKRAKFVHYRPRTAVLNNLEYDHADIYPDVAAIRWQFHQLLRTVPASGRILVNADDANLRETLAAGCWTPTESFRLESPNTAGGDGDAGAALWTADVPDEGAGRRFDVRQGGRVVGCVDWSLIGTHNVMNALAAIAAAHHVGVAPERAVLALRRFHGVKRRMEIRGLIGGVTVYDDFAHHPTAIATTLRGLRAQVGAARVIAVIESRSNTMRLGVHREQLAAAFAAADTVWFFVPPNLGWDLPAAVATLGSRGRFAPNIDDLVRELAAAARPGDHILIMSNGGFGGLHDKLLAALRQRGADSQGELG
jgi:UDP-N-acetylmuramate: L-alanyl-gamma-D-glutamyl-meso-diaminopimelate ligase